jgi:hypothetical protein
MEPGNYIGLKNSTDLKGGLGLMRFRLARALGLAVREFDVAPLDSDGNGMGAVIGSQLRQDVRDVVLDGFLREGKLGGNLSIAVAGRDQT